MRLNRGGAGRTGRVGGWGVRAAHPAPMGGGGFCLSGQPRSGFPWALSIAGEATNSLLAAL